MDLDILFSLIVTLATRELDAHCGSLLILEGEMLKIKAATGLAEDIIKDTAVKKKEGISGRVLATGRPLVIRNQEELDDLGLTGKRKYNNPSFISVPILMDGLCTGVLNINKKKSGARFDEEDLNFLETLANHATIAIRSASIHQRAQILAALAAGAPPTCPCCSARLDRTAIRPRADVSYVRRRVWLTCGSCDKSLMLDQPKAM